MVVAIVVENALRLSNGRLSTVMAITGVYARARKAFEVVLPYRLRCRRCGTHTAKLRTRAKTGGGVAEMRIDGSDCQGRHLRCFRGRQTGGSKASGAHRARFVLRAEVRRVPAENNLESRECIYIGIQGTGTHSAIQCDGEVGTVSGKTVLGNVLTMWRYRPDRAPLIPRRYRAGIRRFYSPGPLITRSRFRAATVTVGILRLPFRSKNARCEFDGV
jgi:hypothetical protein